MGDTLRNLRFRIVDFLAFEHRNWHEGVATPSCITRACASKPTSRTSAVKLARREFLNGEWLSIPRLRNRSFTTDEVVFVRKHAIAGEHVAAT